MTVPLSTTNGTIPVTNTSLEKKKKDQGLKEILKKLEDAGGLDVLKACGDYEKRANKH